MLEFLELEETVGRAWHRWVGDTRSWPRSPDHAVALNDLRSPLAVCFRGFGGEATVQLQPVRPQTSRHRLKLRQVVGLGEERSDHARRDESAIMLPAQIDLFADRGLNRDLYFWMVAYMAVMGEAVPSPADPLLLDLHRIALGRSIAARVLKAFPGMRSRYDRLCQGVLAARIRGRLPGVESQVEGLICLALTHPLGHVLPENAMPSVLRAPAGYLPMLPVPLWPDFVAQTEMAATEREDLPSKGDAASNDRQAHAATRKQDRDDRGRDPFILNRFEKILAMAEMVNVDRPTDDRDDDAQAANELDEMSLSETKERPKSRFHFDLDLSPEAFDPTRIQAESTYPEWNYRKQFYLEDYCRVVVTSVEEPLASSVLACDDMLVRKVKRQFETLRPRRELLRSQVDGNDLDLEAVVRSRTDFLATGQPDDRIYQATRPMAHELATSILVDVSLSTDSWVDNHRVLDVEKQALDVFARGLDACGDSFAINTFTSRRRSWVRIETVKAFHEAFSPKTVSRINAMRPGYYTRMGAAIRHVTAELSKQSSRKKLLLMLTDGKPNDVDHYEGRFALEDSRRAVGEARALGLSVFAVTIDRNAQDYLPAIFGRGGFALVSDITRLPAALPAIYRGLVC
ncbi:VWA domain-containing protein (plasmid) [Rhizobium sullae]|uniref:VWA domain-containing protein n=1 Tax=Rhizobium sullae TaxID=50338 RepID=A0A2N0DB17_RHISU|nr:VWA domain-containing protein [Rhizobium sullae]PKA43291.1 VWA domain-containing protein [Rhizobium sullae]UWU18716.1 VWA domain-containing protein [Rhizobium sullae]